MISELDFEHGKVNHTMIWEKNVAGEGKSESKRMSLGVDIKKGASLATAVTEGENGK